MIDDSSRRRSGRSSSRVRVVSPSPSRTRRLAPRPYYRSESLDSEIERLEIIDSRRQRRRRSPSVEIVERVQYIDEAPRRSAIRETVYIDERGPARRRSGYDNVYDDDDNDVEFTLPSR